MQIFKNASNQEWYQKKREDHKNNIDNSDTSEELISVVEGKRILLDDYEFYKSLSEDIKRLIDTLEIKLESITFIGTNYWNNIRITIKNCSVSMSILNNYSSLNCLNVFIHNGTPYLLLQEDYQGFSILNLKTGNYQVYIPERADSGFGYCIGYIRDIVSNETGVKITGDGCYWACPFTDFSIHFSDPDDIKEVTLTEYNEEGDDFDDECETDCSGRVEVFIDKEECEDNEQ